jgi:hypothetical protein
LSDFEEGLLAVGAVVIALFLIDTILEQEFWLFSVTALISWSVADFIYELLHAYASTDPTEFVIYSLVIIGASALGAWAVQQLMPTLLSAPSPNASKLDFATILGYSVLAAFIAYLLPNLPTLLGRGEPFP